MKVFNLGSINADRIYRVPHLPRAGETLAATAHQVGLGGKGANQSVAAARAGAEVVHIGAVGADGGWMIETLGGFGINTAHIRQGSVASGHAIVAVDDAGENAIVLHPGANREIDQRDVAEALDGAGPRDWLMLQNETNCQAEAARIARGKGAKVAYSAAPFEADAARAMLPLTDLLILNEGEAAQLAEALGTSPDALPVPRVIVTKGAKGAVWLEPGKSPLEIPAFDVRAVDTTGAGDTFAGFVVAALAERMMVPAALRHASAAAALMVTREGTAEAIPTRGEVDTFLNQ